MEGGVYVDPVFYVTVSTVELFPDAGGSAEPAGAVVTFTPTNRTQDEARVALPSPRTYRVAGVESVALMHPSGWLVPFAWTWRLEYGRGQVLKGGLEVPEVGGTVTLASQLGVPVALPDGTTAEMMKGDPGRGIASVTDPDGDGVALVTYTDGTTADLALPRGPAGAPSTVPGPPPTVEWRGYRLVVNGHASPELRGPAGPPLTVAWEGTSLVVGDAAPVDLRGKPGDPGRTPEVGMDGDRLTIDGEAIGPNLTGPAGAKGDKGDPGTPGAKGDTGTPGAKGETGPKGDPSTVPGPPNVLSIGTVSTGAAGSNAAASITGASPEQVLNLTIPQGPAGPAGPAFGADGSIIAAGRPDVAATMDSATQAAVSSAPSGAFFRSTDGPQGAWVWLKKGTTWGVVDADTGWRSLTAGTLSKPLFLRRVGDDLHLLMSTYNSTAGGTTNVSLTAGFRLWKTRSDLTGGPIVDDNGNVRGKISFWDGTLVQIKHNGAWSNLGFTLVQPGVIDNWPTTLPGIPA